MTVLHMLYMVCYHVPNEYYHPVYRALNVVLSVRLSPLPSFLTFIICLPACLSVDIYLSLYIYRSKD